MKVYVLVLNWNTAADTLRLYHQLERLNPSYHLLVIDNASSEADRQALRAIVREDEYIQTGSNLGYGGGNNVGIRRALAEGADYVCIVNPDVALEGDCISELIDLAASDPLIGVVGPRICYADDRETIYTDGGLIEPRLGYRVTHINHRRSIHRATAVAREVDYVNGSCIIIKRRLLEEIGLIEEFFFMYFEETEWCMRARRAGFRLIVDPLHTVYQRPSTKGSLYHFHMHRNRVWVAKLHGNVIRTCLLDSLRILKEVAFALVRRQPRTSHCPDRVKGLIHGLMSSPG